MTDSTGTPSTPAGWYADPAGSDRLRWWDGSRWTDHLADRPTSSASAAASPTGQEGASHGSADEGVAAERPASAVAAEPAAAPPAGHVPPVAAPAAAPQPYSQQPYAQAGYAQQAYGTPTPPPRVPASTSPFTWAIWVLAALPVISIVLALNVDYRSAFDMGSRGPSPDVAIASALSSLVNFLVYAGTVVLAFLDWRDLTRRGIVRPFHWAWAFIPVAGGVYLIGRSIVVRRRIEGSPANALSPIWLWIGLNVIVMFISLVKFVEVFSSTMQMYGTGRY